jgi:hypothetical protein
MQIVQVGDPLESLAQQSDIRERVRAALAGGAIAAIPADGLSDSAESETWWQIDPTDGTTLGMGDRGWGQGVEYAILAGNLIGTATCIVKGATGSGPAMGRERFPHLVCTVVSGVGTYASVMGLLAKEKAKEYEIGAAVAGVFAQLLDGIDTIVPK